MTGTSETDNPTGDGLLVSLAVKLDPKTRWIDDICCCYIPLCRSTFELVTLTIMPNKPTYLFERERER